MTEDFEARLRRELADTVPPAPPEPMRAPRARDRAQRTRRARMALAGTAVVVAVLAAVAVPTLVGPRQTPPTPEAGEAVDGPGALENPYECSDLKRPKDIDYPEGGVLADGPVLARMCPYGALPWQAPRDALTDPVALQRLVGVVNGLPETGAEAGEGCTFELGRAYALTFQYADGRTATVTGNLFGCAGVTVERGEAREDASAPWDAYVDALLAQRSRMAPPRDVDVPLGCEYGGGSALPQRPSLQLQEAVLCWNDDRQSRPTEYTAPLSAEQVQQVNRDFTETATKERLPSRDCSGSAADLSIVGYNEWGDRVSIHGYCHVYLLGRLEWTPSAETRRMLEEVVASVPVDPVAVPGPDAPADEVVAAYVDLLNEGQLDTANQLLVEPRWSQTSDVPTIDIFKVWEKRPTDEPGYAEATRVIAHIRFIGGENPTSGDYEDWQFTLVRDSTDETWRILDDGPYES